MRSVSSEMKASAATNRRPFIAPIIGMIFLAFVAGAFVSEFHFFPYRMLFERAFKYMHASSERKTQLATARAEGHDVPPTGNVVISRAGTFDGYTFLSFDAGRPSTARLIDMQGNVLHEWHRPLSKIWPDHPLSQHAWPDYAAAWRNAELFPNGDIITTVKAYGDSPEGCGLLKLDKDSKIVWAIADHFHHQFSLDEQGNIYALVHEYRDTQKNPVKGAPFLPKTVSEDFVVKISPDGKELMRVSLLEAMAQSGFREMLGSSVFNGYKSKEWDRMHPNSVQVIGKEFASHHDFTKPGMVLVSLRELDALIVFDLEKKSVEWALRGAWVRQHDPQMLPNGNVLLFDNRGNNTGRGTSRALEVDIELNRVVWSFEGTNQQPLESEYSGGVQRLANGNTLISEDDGGRLLEVTDKDEVVWEYHDVRLHRAVRITKDWLKFEPKIVATAK